MNYPLIWQFFEVYPNKGFYISGKHSAFVLGREVAKHGRIARIYKLSYPILVTLPYHKYITNYSIRQV